MAKMKCEYIEKIYAGWIAKIIGIRLGAAIEGWTYDKIKNIYGELDGYPVDFHEFAADDDSNVPLFFLRSLEDSGKWKELEAQDVAEALMNYAPVERGFFWWGGPGGYGISTEHTAYMNLKSGIKAPLSGSVELNGAATAEQIGGQIFIDTWGLVTPGNPDLAAVFAEKAASVTHGGNAVYGGIFVASCISYAFVETDIRKIIDKGLSYIPEDCEYAQMVRRVIRYYDEHPSDWEACYAYIHDNYGYDKYPGACHIMPNIAVMILALMYGEGDFSRTLNICNRCGWDTDCNVGNIATIMGVRGGLEVIDYHKWRKPVNDFLACSSVMGSLNIMDLPYGASYIIKLASILSGEELPEPYHTIIKERIDSCHFEYPGSTHAIRVRVEHTDRCAARETNECLISNTEESAATGLRSLKVVAKPVQEAERFFVYKKTYYRPSDFHDNRLDPSFSPVVYPGQIIHGSAYIPEYAQQVGMSLYAREAHSGKIYQSSYVYPEKDRWQTMEYQIPSLEGGLIDEMGFCFCVYGEKACDDVAVVLVDDLYADGKPSYSVELSTEDEERWTLLHREIAQFTRLKGNYYLENGQLNLSCYDYGEVYTGRHDWKDYKAEFSITPVTGGQHMVNVRVQGASRSYAVALLGDGKAALLKNENGYRMLNEISFNWEYGKEYQILVETNGNEIHVSIDGDKIFHYTDDEMPYMEGSVGISVRNGSRIKCRRIIIS